MLELIGLIALVVVGGLVLTVLGLVVGLLKVVFKVALIPVWLGLAAIKWLVLIVLCLVGVLVCGPIVVGLGLLALLPIAILGMMVWAAVAVVT